MSFIKQVTIAGHRIQVRVKDMGGDPYGQYLPDAHIIELDKSIMGNPKLLKETLRHEMVEAALFISGVAWSERYDQEPIVRALDEIFWPAWERVEERIKAYV